jgi:hypothetical protein
MQQAKDELVDQSTKDDRSLSIRSECYQAEDNPASSVVEISAITIGLQTNADLIFEIC